MRQIGPLSRADLARETALTMQSISNIIAGLEESGLINASQKIHGGKGQPPLPYAIRAEAGYGLGIHLDQGHITAAVVDFGLNPLTVREFPYDLGNPEAALEDITQVITALKAEIGLVDAQLWGIGLASPRLYNEQINQLGLLEATPWANFAQFQLDERLSARSNLPVFSENAANAGALAELTFGAGKQFDHFCYLHIAQGLGCGIVSGGALFRGAWGNAGEVGRLPVPDLCAHAATTTYFEDVLSLAGLFQDLGEPQNPLLTFEALEHLLAKHSEGIARWTVKASSILHYLVSILENSFDPQSILIGGDLPDKLLADLLKAAMPLHHTISNRGLFSHARVQPSTHRSHSAALGAAAIPLVASIDPSPEESWQFAGRIKDVYPA